MLEIRHVTKTYRPKKGVPVKALDDVSVSFPDRGMVFILGKSGSGKSTLLNVLGGLDRADEGEFIIKGKSSKDFSQSDFDSYRNTFIGFIFQEYNILSEFTVGANIALAMELQGKKADNESLNKLLDDVDLNGYGSRKPNELSGGQKQRVAIARALIKNPEMIMADEPTGALDSKTGKQVFDTLKKLSETKLVLVVSHDRDFAELYADRIIELADGKIISDVTKTEMPPHNVSDGISVVDDKIIRVRKGYKLTARDLELINEYMAKSDSDALISIDERSNDEIRKVVKINDDGGKDEFVATDESKIGVKTYSPADSKLIRSRLPFKNAFRMGASSLKAKPIRLAFTIFLCFIAFAMFGLADTMGAYNKCTAFESSIIDSHITNAAFIKQNVNKSSGGYTYYNDKAISADDITAISAGSGVNVKPVLKRLRGENGNSSLLVYTLNCFNDTSSLTTENGISFYSVGSDQGLIELDQTDLDTLGFTLTGTLPAASDEIAITKYVFEKIQYTGFDYYETATSEDKHTLAGRSIADAVSEVTDENVVIGKYVDVNAFFGDTRLKIVGVIDTKLDSSPYADYMPFAQKKEMNMLASMMIQSELDAKISYSYNNLLAVSDGKLAEIIAKSKENKPEYISLGYDAYLDFRSNDSYEHFSGVMKLDTLKDKNDVVWTGEAKTSLAEDEIILPYNAGNREYKASTLSWIASESGISEEEMQNYYADFTSLLSGYGYITDYYIKKAFSDNGKGDYYPASAAFKYYCLKYDDSIRYSYNNYREWDNANPDEAWDKIDASIKHNAYVEYLTDTYRSVAGSDYICGGFFDNAFGEGEGITAKSGRDIIMPLIKGIIERENIAYTISYDGNSSNMPSAGKLTVSCDYGRDEWQFGYTVVGYYIPGKECWSLGQFGESSFAGNVPIVSDGIYAKFATDSEAYYAFALGAMPESRAGIRKVVNFNYDESTGVRYSLKNEVSSSLESFNSTIEMMSKVFLYVGIGFAVFASLMMFNFISVSISYKKREIGILRAVGARSSDVFSIFFHESFLITLINFVLASAAATVAVFFINKALREELNLALTLLTIGVRQYLLIFAVGLLVAFVSSFLPVMKIAKKRPIDAIQNR